MFKLGDKEIEVDDIEIKLCPSTCKKEYNYPREINFEWTLHICLCYNSVGCPFSTILFVNEYAILYCNLFQYQVHGVCMSPAWRDFQCYKLKREMITND